MGNSSSCSVRQITHLPAVCQPIPSASKSSQPLSIAMVCPEAAWQHLPISVNICQYFCKYSHRGQFEATKMTLTWN